MAGGEEKTGDFYAVLGLNKECSESELRNAYKKLAMRWHPDRCSAPGNSNTMDESKNKFQAIQEAYSVLSDSNKRFLYDVGAYDSDDDENQGMGDFLGEMAQMMSQTKPSENGPESFEDLQQLFVDLFQTDLDAGFGGSPASGGGGRDRATSSSASPPPFFYGNKRGNSAMNSAGRTNLYDLGTGHGHGHAAFCFGSNNKGETLSKGRGSSNSKRRNGRKQKVSSKHDVSSRDTEIST